MAKKQEDTKRITANALSVRNGTLIAGHITFQIRNIASVVAQRRPDDFLNVSALAFGFSFALACGTAFLLSSLHKAVNQNTVRSHDYLLSSYVSYFFAHVASFRTYSHHKRDHVLHTNQQELEIPV